MKKTIVRIGQAIPSVSNLIWSALYPFIRKDEVWVGTEYSNDHKEVFETIFNENRWQSAESRSGDGSTLVQTTFVRRALPGLLTEFEGRVLLDAPCGDFNWMQHVDLPDFTRYIGGDIVAPMIEELQTRYASHQRRFVSLDIVTDPLPEADIWLCRDVLFHLPASDILRVLRNFASSQTRFMLTTTYPFVGNNRDVRAGGFRFINLMKPPFNLPKPRKLIDDFVFPEPPRKLGLWSRDEVAGSLAKGGSAPQ